MLRYLHRGMLKLLSIGQQDGKEADLPPLAQTRPASFWLPGSDAQAYLARRVGGPVGEVVVLEREEGNMRHGTHPRQQFIFLCPRAGVLRPLRGDALLNRRARAASGAAERELTFLPRLRRGTILPFAMCQGGAVEKSLGQVAVKSHTPTLSRRRHLRDTHVSNADSSELNFCRRSMSDAFFPIVGLSSPAATEMTKVGGRMLRQQRKLCGRVAYTVVRSDELTREWEAPRRRRRQSSEQAWWDRSWYGCCCCRHWRVARNAPTEPPCRAVQCGRGAAATKRERNARLARAHVGLGHPAGHAEEAYARWGR